MADAPRGILVIDLDGTLCLGDAPVRSFARLAEQETGLAGLVDGLDSFLAGELELGVKDGYQAVFALARKQAPLELESMSAAFRQSRLLMKEWLEEVWAPPGIADLLESIKGTVRRVLVTNSPADNLNLLLPALGVHRGLDGILTSAKKPRNMARVLDGVQLVAPTAQLGSLGDIWENDHAEVHKRGGVTFLIDRHGLGEGTPTARAAEAEELYPAIEEWAGRLAAG